MIYVVNDELIPQSNEMHNHFADIGLLAGLIVWSIIKLNRINSDDIKSIIFIDLI